MVYQQQHSLDEAIPYLEKATRLEPQKPDAFLMLGQVMYVSGQQEKSIPLLRRAIELTTDPSRNEYQIANGQYLLGQALLRQGNTDEAKTAPCPCGTVQVQVLGKGAGAVKNLLA
jgi:tetratricopeptide (TPR) repeat protein